MIILCVFSHINQDEVTEKQSDSVFNQKPRGEEEKI